MIYKWSKVDDERYIDLKDFVQRRYDDPNKRRNVKREIVASDEEKPKKKRKQDEKEEEEDNSKGKKMKEDKGTEEKTADNPNNTSSYWETLPQTVPTDPALQHKKERELYQRFLQHQESAQGNLYLRNQMVLGTCNTLIHGPDAPPFCTKEKKWNVWKCIRCGTINKYPQASCQVQQVLLLCPMVQGVQNVSNNCDWIQWGWICIDHNGGYCLQL